MDNLSKNEKYILNRGVKFTTIDHVAREELNLDLTEYAIADSIYHLSNGPSNKVPGWCNASKEYLARFIGRKPRQVFNIINKLIKAGLIEKNEDLLLRTTEKWFETVVMRKDRMKAIRKEIEMLINKQ